MKIWAHRGCSQMYPENTITSFEKAMNIPGLEGIELDIQLTSDGELVVIHDERVDRTTEGFGYVRDYSLTQLKRLHIYSGMEKTETIPTMREVFELLQEKLKGSLRLNIELKNSIYSYPGMEEKIIEMVYEYGVQDAIVYSSFNADSLVEVLKMAPDAQVGVLDGTVSNCMYEALGIESLFAGRQGSLALHPNGQCIDMAAERLSGRSVRAYFGGHLFPDKPTPGKMNLDRLEAAGVTDVFLNEPEKYL